MNVFRSIALLVALLLQIGTMLPVRAGTETAMACGMACCCEAVEVVCDCVTDSAPAEPPPLLPAGARERLPQVLGMTFENAQIAAGAATSRERAQAHELDRDPPKLPHVRLAVLFCSFLN